MTRDDWLWLLIRIVGLFFIAKAVCVVPEICANCILLLYQPQHAFGGDGTLQLVREDVTVHAWATLAGAAIKFIGYGATGVYLCRRGKGVHRILQWGDRGLKHTGTRAE